MERYTALPPGLTPHVLGLLRRIYDAAQHFHAEHGYAPTFRELGELVELSPTQMHARIRQMRRAGHVTYVDDSPRTLVLKSRP